MQKSVFSIVAVIAIAAMLLVVNTPTHFAKAFSCGSSASGGGNTGFNARFASLGTKFIHHTHPIMNLNRQRLLAQVKAIKRILNV